MSITLEKTQVHETVQFVLKYRGHMLSFKPMGFDVLTLGIQSAFASEAEAMIQQELVNNSFMTQCGEVDTVVGNAMRQIKEHIEINTRVFCYLTNFKYKTMIDIINGPDVDYYNEIVASPAFMSFIHNRFGKDSWDIRNASPQIRETLNQVIIEFSNFFTTNPKVALQHILRLGNFGQIETACNKMHKTPDELAIIMVNTIPASVLKNPNSTFFDPCCGTGTFIFSLISELQKYHTLEHIITKMIYANDISYKYIFLVKSQMEALCLSQTGRIITTNLTTHDILEVHMERKFDVIIGNPPYQNAGETGGASSLWRKITKKVWSLVADNGRLCFVTPQLSNSANDLGYIYTNHQTEFVFTDVKKYFPKIGSDFRAWCVCNTPKTKPTYFVDDDVYVVIDNTPLPVNIRSMSIIQKFKSYPTHFKCQSSPEYYHTQITPKRDEHHLSATIKHPYMIRRTSGENYHMYGAIEPTHYYDTKVVLTYSGYPHYQVHNHDTPIGTIKYQSGHILVDSVDAGDNLIHLYNSRLYRFVIKQTTTAGMRGASTYELPQLDLTRQYTDSELYTIFNLTNEEIALINNML